MARAFSRVAASSADAFADSDWTTPTRVDGTEDEEDIAKTPTEGREGTRADSSQSRAANALALSLARKRGIVSAVFTGGNQAPGRERKHFIKR